MKTKLFLSAFLFVMCITNAQEDLLDEFDSIPPNSYKSAAFKGLKIVNFESTLK